mmetsp:Transcript_22085/g.32629  ORF Transcript_22085/g.32629 Transcript_22085/m.32629 type:complete len:454 (+) Transcript_22085:146-1507(+)|eukprot:CAMPEP_0194225454 /NCGR_PEP_ID=MMETSP0156-20130528/39649_1 /TAXON_ID=33649 /ORGANISM="Thalassionema nitzschioides, Strain L26-B" /LENGTH=453 /DNA_ID=CAMNT_0038957395 /DNA_START=77 /DNA_END=1438 /DNA_ORIENTATION=+
MSEVIGKSNKSTTLTGGVWKMDSKDNPREEKKSIEKGFKKRSFNIGGTWGFDDSRGKDELLDLNVSVGRGSIPDDSSIDDSTIGSADYVDTSVEVYESSDTENSIQPARKTSSLLGGLLDPSPSYDSPDESLDGTESSFLGSRQSSKKQVQFDCESSKESFSKKYARTSLPPRPPGKGDSRYAKSCNILRQLNNLESTDTEIYEDEQEDSSKCESESNDERSRGSRSHNSYGSQRSDFNWSSYNQKRGRYLAKRLLAKVHEKQPLSRMDSTQMLSNKKHTLAFGINHWFSRHHHIGATTKQISKDYVVVDATVAQASLANNEAPSRSSTRHGTQGPHPALASNSKAKGSNSETQMAVKEQSTIVRTPGFPEGLLRRTTVDDIISTQKLGSRGRKAIQKLDRFLQEKNKPNASLNIWGVEIVNYEARVKSLVASFRRDVLEISDAKYLDLLTKA